MVNKQKQKSGHCTAIHRLPKNHNHSSVDRDSHTTQAHRCQREVPVLTLKGKSPKTLLSLLSTASRLESPTPSHIWGWGAGWKATVETTGWKAIPQLNILPTFHFPLGAVACFLALT